MNSGASSAPKRTRVVVTVRVRGCGAARTGARRLRASGRPWKRRGFCARNGPGAGARYSSNARRGRSRPPLCRSNGGCAWGRLPRRPATSRGGVPGSGSPAGGARAGRGRCPPNGPRRDVGHDLARPAAPGAPDPARVGLATHEAPGFVQLQHVAPARRAGASRSMAGGLRLFSPSHLATVCRAPPKPRSGRPQPQALDLRGPQDQRFALRADGRALGGERPVRSAGFAKTLLRAAGVVSGSAEGRAATGRAARRRRFHAHSIVEKICFVARLSAATVSSPKPMPISRRAVAPCCEALRAFPQRDSLYPN